MVTELETGEPQEPLFPYELEKRSYEAIERLKNLLLYQNDNLSFLPLTSLFLP